METEVLSKGQRITQLINSGVTSIEELMVQVQAYGAYCKKMLEKSKGVENKPKKEKLVESKQEPVPTPKANYDESGLPIVVEHKKFRTLSSISEVVWHLSIDGQLYKSNGFLERKLLTEEEFLKLSMGEVLKLLKENKLMR